MPRGSKTIERFEPSEGAMTEIMSGIGSLTAMYDRGKPKNQQEMRERIDQYFTLCNLENVRPGVESLCLSLGINRMCFWRWSNGEGEQWQMEECQRARAIINASLEQLTQKGKINPVSGIFLLKNWASYSDSTPETAEKPLIQHQQTLEQIRAKYGMNSDNRAEIIDIEVVDDSNK